MNKIRNWSIVSAALAAASLASVAVPVAALGLGIAALAAGCVALVRYEDSISYKGKF